MDDRAAKKAKIGDLVREAYDKNAKRGYGMILAKIEKEISPGCTFCSFHVHWFRPEALRHHACLTKHSEWDLMVYDL